MPSEATRPPSSTIVRLRIDRIISRSCDAAQIMELFKEQNARGTTILVASHDREMIRSMRKRTIVLEGGRVASDGIYR